MTPRVLFFECCNFEDYPVGGQLSFARQMVRTFGPRLALVGVSTDDTPVGQWVKRDFEGWTHDFFSTGRRTESAQKPLIPLRIRSYLGIAKYRRQILSLDTRVAFITSREALLATYKWGWSNLCFLCSGLENPLRMSRYKGALLLARVYDSCFVPAAQSADLLLAAADRSTIQEFAAGTGGRIRKEDIISFPTRADTDIFHPTDQSEAREALGVPSGVPVFTTVGRLNLVKGWDLLIDAFRVFLRRTGKAHFYFVGDGEDRRALERRLQEYGLAERVHITGYLGPQKIAVYLNAADVFVLGSRSEGWPTVMVEALATGKPIVSTRVSGAAELIDQGKNGYIVALRDAKLFAEAMDKALSLDALSYSLEKSRPYALNRLAEDLGKLWAPLCS